MSTALLNQLLRMNLIGVYGIGLAFIIRPLLRKAGSRYCYYLWMIVFLNLAVPTVLTGSFSLIPKQLYQVELSRNQETAAVSGTASMYDENVDSGRTQDEYFSLREGAVDQLADVSSAASQDITESQGTLKISERIWRQAVSIFGGTEAFARCLLMVWISVAVLLFILEGAQYLKMRRHLRSLALIDGEDEKGVVTLRGLNTPLLFGFFYPTVYLPDSLNGEEKAYIVRHELYHRKRRDNIVKGVALCITILYWYNPLVWLAFHFLGVDMELSCDEAVLLKSDLDIKKAYAGSLLKYGALQNHYILTSLTFGEPGLKARIKNVLNFQKRGVVITAVALLMVALLAVGLLVRPASGEEKTETLSGEEETAQQAYISQETYGWALEETSLIHHDAVVYEIEDAYPYGEIAGNYVSEDSAYVAYHLEDARICVLSTHDAGESWQQTYIGEAGEMDALGVIYLSFLENGTGYLLYTSSPGAGQMTKVLYTSVDGGVSFTLTGDITDSVQNYPQWMVFYDENMGMILTQYHGYEAFACLTTDGGITWSALDLNVPDAEGSSYIDGLSLIQTDKEADIWVMRLRVVYDDKVDIYQWLSMDGWAAFCENGTAAQAQTEDDEAMVDPLAHTAEQILQFADILSALDEQDYCQILTIHGYSILLVANGTYDTSWARGTDHGTIGAEVYFPGTEMYIYSMGTAYPLRYNAEGIYVEWNTGTHTIYTLEEESGKLLTEERELNEGEWDTLYDIPFVTKAELLTEAGISEEELENTADELENETDLAQKEALEQALLKADGEALTMETLMELVNGGYSALTEFDYANCENAVLNYTESAGVLSYCYEFALEYEGAAYTFRANYYKDDHSLDMLYLSDDAGTEDLFCLCRVNEVGNDDTVSPEDFESYLQETAIKSSRSWSLESFPLSVDLPDGYTLGTWDWTIGSSVDSSATMSGGVLIYPAAYELQEGYEEEALVAEWQYYAGFLSRIGEGCWSWDGDTLIPGFPLGNHMVFSYVEMVDGTAKIAYLLEVEYDMYTSSTEGKLEESGVSLGKIDTVSKYWYIIFVDDGVGAATGYCLGLAQNQFTKEEAVAMARSVVFAQ
ncbi:MAG: hypothetical protein LUH19_00170 [Lachnospiraceae bacterium]|nr:hypothetical protein [Lachnospiraceae bacterium]